MKKLYRSILLLSLVLAAGSLFCSWTPKAQPTPNGETQAMQATMQSMQATMQVLQAEKNASTQTAPSEPKTGGISGKLGYPSEGIPALRIVAYEESKNFSVWYDINIEPNTKTYQINNLPAGDYIVVAYHKNPDLAGGYTQAVLCGLEASCEDHNLVTVTVTAGQITKQVDILDWYAPEGTFPKAP